MPGTVCGYKAARWIASFMNRWQPPPCPVGELSPEPAGGIGVRCPRAKRVCPEPGVRLGSESLEERELLVAGFTTFAVVKHATPDERIRDGVFVRDAHSN